MKNILDRIRSGLFILDGAMGTLLQENGMPPGQNPTYSNFSMPDTVKSIHKSYLDVGTDLILTNTLCASDIKLMEQPVGKPVTSAEMVSRAVELAREAAAGYGAYVALDIGSIGELIEPTGTFSFKEAYGQFKTQVIAGEKAGADAIFIETITDLQEMRCALLAAKENSRLPVFCTMSFEETMRTFTGTCLPSFAVTIEGLGADALGINCSLGPAQVLPMLKELMKWTGLPIIAKPNAGMPSIVNGKTVFNVEPSEFAEQMTDIVKLGVNIIGGCCGSTPDHIAAIAPLGKEAIDLPGQRKRADYVVCSPSKAVEFDKVRVVGERINPTGKKRFKQALMNGDTDYILAQAVEQVEAGADILDVNVGLPGIDEAVVLSDTVKAVQSVTGAPLQIDSTNPQAIDAALRLYCGKAIVNSVNGEESSLSTVLPMVKKYGAAVVGLAMDDNGIPKTAEGRLAVAKKIVNRAVEYGIPESDIIIDCLTLTAAAEQETAYETLKALRLVKEQLRVKTTLGVSNISFGLPGRERLNQVFLAMALENGLDLPIINPNNSEMVDTVYCFHQLRNIDAGSGMYIGRFKEAPKAKASTESYEKPHDVDYYIQKGFKEETKSACISLLKNHDGMFVINEHLVPALDNIGRNYETGKIFLPELMRASEAAKAGFEAVKESLPQQAGDSQGRIILATVKGDVHDIGKNIVMSILMSYGYDVTDLGRDVDAEQIVKVAKELGARLVGLSALMTTTVPSMEQTIKMMKAVLPETKIMVGGAVLTKEYALGIGADFYAKDAMDAVAIAKRVFLNVLETDFSK